MSTVSGLSGLYHRLGLANFLVANSSSEIVRLSNELVTNSQRAYFIRVRLLEAVDEQYFKQASRTASAPDIDFLGLIPNPFVDH